MVFWYFRQEWKLDASTNPGDISPGEEGRDMEAWKNTKDKELNLRIRVRHRDPRGALRDKKSDAKN